MGSPGSGKGTQAARIAERLKVDHVSTGDIFRDEIARQTDLGLQAEACVKSGRLVPDNLVLSMVLKRLDRPEGAGGFILDGFPRTIDQAQGLSSYLGKKVLKLNHVFYLDLPEDLSISRIAGRRYCLKCQMVYNIATNPSKVDSVCDRCSGKLVSRSDDEQTTFKKRLMVYQELTSPLIAYYKAAESFINVDATRSMDEITDQIFGRLNGGRS